MFLKDFIGDSPLWVFLYFLVFIFSRYWASYTGPPFFHFLAYSTFWDISTSLSLSFYWIFISSTIVLISKNFFFWSVIFLKVESCNCLMSAVSSFSENINDSFPLPSPPVVSVFSRFDYFGVAFVLDFPQASNDPWLAAPAWVQWRKSAAPQSWLDAVWGSCTIVVRLPCSPVSSGLFGSQMPQRRLFPPVAGGLCRAALIGGALGSKWKNKAVFTKSG